MAHKDLKQKALNLRSKGYSYSQIKNEIGVSKSTLSNWLYSMPLSEDRIRQLQADSPIRIERYRNTMRKKKEVRLGKAYDEVSKKIGKLNSRELFLVGLFLYWAEGTKSRKGGLELTNTNPGMLQFFIKWLELFEFPKSTLRAHLHLYSDMNIKKQTQFWAKTLGLSTSQFRNPYIKENLSTSITYKTGFGQGTCSITAGNTELFNQIIMGIKYIQEMNAIDCNK